MPFHEVTPGWRSISGHRRRRVIYRQLPELAGQACYRVDGDRQGTIACALLEVYLRLGGSGPRRATCFPMAGKSPWRSLAADTCVKSLWRDLLTPSLGLTPASLQPLSQSACLSLTRERPAQTCCDTSPSASCGPASHTQELSPPKEGQNKPLGQSSGSHMWAKSSLACSSAKPNEEERPANLFPTKSRTENQSQAVGLPMH